jgi:hypothetical protein
LRWSVSRWGDDYHSRTISAALKNSFFVPQKRVCRGVKATFGESENLGAVA